MFPCMSPTTAQLHPKQAGGVSRKGTGVAWYRITHRDKDVTLSAPLPPEYNNYTHSFVQA